MFQCSQIVLEIFKSLLKFTLPILDFSVFFIIFEDDRCPIHKLQTTTWWFEQLFNAAPVVSLEYYSLPEHPTNDADNM